MNIIDIIKKQIKENIEREINDRRKEIILDGWMLNILQFVLVIYILLVVAGFSLEYTLIKVI